MTLPTLVCYNGKLIEPVFGLNLCGCGCGAAPRIYCGVTMRYVKGHAQRLQGPDWKPLDCGHKQGPCWIWQKLLTPDGYARISVHRNNRRAHRVYYEHYVGPIPEGKQIDHLCRVRACVNPWHLEPVPPAANVRRGAKALYTEDDILRMMEMRKRGIFYKDIAAMFGAKVEYVQSICYGKRWQGIVPVKELPRKTTRVTSEQIEEMTRLRKTGLAAADIGDHFGISHWRVYAILRRRNLGRATIGRRTRSQITTTGLKTVSSASS